MPATFLHGVETIEIPSASGPISEVRTAIIGLVGTAPIQDLADPANATVNQFVVCSNEKDDAKYFGAETEGYTIPTALKWLRKMGAGLVVVVNVFDPENVAHQTTGTPDPSLVTSTDIIGTVDAGGNRTGMQAWLDVRSARGFSPKILIAPGYHTQQTVASELRTLSAKMRAVNAIDAAIGTTFSQVLANRGVVGNAFSTSDKRTILCYPHVKVTSAITGNQVLEALSIFVAGIMAKKDRELGYWWSPSNTEVPYLEGLEVALTAAINDPDSEVNQLNAEGILTLFNDYGTGIRTWGNRSAAHPAESRSFIHSTRVGDVIHESIEYYMLRHMDKPMSGAVLDEVTENVNDFLRSLQGKGAIVDGKCWLAADNTTASLSAGQSIWEYDWVDPPSLERMTFRSAVNNDYLAQLVGGAA